jgi:hypothetical protein
MSANELREAIKAKGKKAPFHVNSTTLLEEYLEAVNSGYSDEELASLFPKNTPPPTQPTVEATTPPVEAPKATEKQPIQAGLDLAVVQQMIANAIASDRETRTRPADQQVQVSMTKAPEKPITWNSREATEEDFLAEGFRVFHANCGHSFDKFKINGRLVDPPFSKLLMFEQYDGPETQAFGASQDLSVMCVHTTYSKTIRDMFLADSRIGGEFWTTSNRVMSDDLELSMLITKTTRVLEGIGQIDLQTMCTDRGLEFSDVETMRAKIAMHDSKKTQAERKLHLAGNSIAMEKEQLLSA